MPIIFEPISRFFAAETIAKLNHPPPLRHLENVCIVVYLRGLETIKDVLFLALGLDGYIELAKLKFV